MKVDVLGLQPPVLQWSPACRLGSQQPTLILIDKNSNKRSSSQLSTLDPGIRLFFDARSTPRMSDSGIHTSKLQRHECP